MSGLMSVRPGDRVRLADGLVHTVTVTTFNGYAYVACRRVGTENWFVRTDVNSGVVTCIRCSST